MMNVSIALDSAETATDPVDYIDLLKPKVMTLEWTVSSPPPFHQFEIQPRVN